MAHRAARVVYRALLRLYPRAFRDRFAHDLDADFADMLAARGTWPACRYVVLDLVHSLAPTHRHAHGIRARELDIAGEHAMGSFLFDIRHAIRGLLKSPVFTAVTVATLALAIGANSAIFSLVSAVLLRPIGYQAPERLMLVYEGIPEANIVRFGVSPPDYLDFVAYQRTFSAVGAYRTRTLELSGAGEPQQITVGQLTPSVWPVLGVSAASGRTFVESDASSEERVAVLSDGLWRRAFGGQPVIGGRVILDRQPYTVIGVMSREFQFPRRGPQLNGEPADVWVPLVFTPFERQARGMFYNQSVIGRLNDGMTADQAVRDIAALAPRIRENYPAQLRNSPFSLVVEATPLADEIAGRVRRPLLILLGAVGLVLLVACANVANLMVSRAAVRQREIGVRAALGARRRRLFQMLLAESVLLASTAGVLGLALGYWVVRAMPAVIATSLPGVADVTLDGRVVAFTFAISAATAIAFSLVPLVAGGRSDLNSLLREGATRTTADARHRLQGSLVVASVALAFVLLIGAGLLTRSLNSLLAVETGVRADNVLSFHIALPYAGYNNAARVRSFYKTLLARLAALPAVRFASISSDLPLEPDGERRAVTPERTGDAGGQPPSMAVTWIHGDYFATFGIPIVRGRTFSAEEQDEDRLVAIVSHGLAERFWPGEDPIGKRIKWGIATSTAPWRTIVGTVGDVVDGALASEPILHVYVPYSEIADQALAAPVLGLVRRMVMAVHTAGDAATLAGPSRAAVASLDRALAVFDVNTMSQVVSNASAPERFSARVLTAFAAGALLLAGIGLYGVLAFGVAQRTREIGVRLALGARRSEVVGLVMRQGMTLTIIGLVLGAAGALAATRFMRSLLFETDPLDLWTFATVPFVLATVALAACYLPARRAATTDPMTALRTE